MNKKNKTEYNNSKKHKTKQNKKDLKKVVIKLEKLNTIYYNKIKERN